MIKLSTASLASVMCFTAAASAQTTLTLQCIKDCTLIETTAGTSANGSGTDLFAGATVGNGLRRGLIKFDLSAVPGNAVISGVTLRLWVTKTVAGAVDVNIHRTLSDWGEGPSVGGGFSGGGAGTPATAGDTTWLHRFFPNQFWASPGGDFDAFPSATSSVAGNGPYVWTGPGLLADVRGWLSDPTTNFGWCVRGEEILTRSTKRFAARENVAANERPMLDVTYTLPACYANCDASTTPPVLTANDFQCFLNAFSTGSSYANCDGSTADPVLTANDFQCFLNAFSNGCLG